MSSQTDKKEDFRKYLEKANVLVLLTTILTDLFEMDNKPEDPCQYIYQRFGEALKKPDAAVSGQPDGMLPATTTEPSGKDVNMSETPSAVPAKQQDPTAPPTPAAPPTTSPPNNVQQPVAPPATTANHAAVPSEAATSEPVILPTPAQGANISSVPLADGQSAATPGNAVVPPGTAVQQPPGPVPQVNNTQAPPASAQ